VDVGVDVRMFVYVRVEVVLDRKNGSSSSSSSSHSMLTMITL